MRNKCFLVSHSLLTSVITSFVVSEEKLEAEEAILQIAQMRDEFVTHIARLLRLHKTNLRIFQNRFFAILSFVIVSETLSSERV